MLDRLTLTFPKFARLVSTGSEAAARVDQVKYVRLTNSCAVFTLVISVIYAAYFAALGAWGPVLLEALMVAMGVLALRLNARGRTYAARHVLLLAANLVTYVFASWQGHASQIHLIYLALLAYSVMLFAPRDWRHVVACLSHQLVAFFVLLYAPGAHEFSLFGAAPEHLIRSNAVVSVLITAGLILSTFVTYSVSIHRSEARAEAALLRLDREMDLVQLLQDVAIIANSATELGKAANSAAERIKRVTGWGLGRFTPLNGERRASCGLERDCAASARSVWRRRGSAQDPSWCEACRQAFGPGPVPLMLVTVPIVAGRDATIAMLQFTNDGPVPPSTEMLANLDNMGRQLGMIFERRRAQDEVAESHVKMIAAAKMATLGEMAGGIAHEINNPLSVIQGYLARIRRGIEWPDARERTEESIAEINATLMRITRIVNGLRAFARDSTADPFEPVKIQRVMADTLALSAERFRSRGIALAVEPVDPALELECRPSQISQVLINLLNNAFDAVQEGRARGSKRVSLATRDRGDTVELVVEDDGPGIPTDVREKVLLPFFTTKPVGRGTGLGLSISKGIVESHTGTLEFWSEPGATRFVVTLPKTQEFHDDGKGG